MAPSSAAAAAAALAGSANCTSAMPRDFRVALPQHAHQTGPQQSRRMELSVPQYQSLDALVAAQDCQCRCLSTRSFQAYQSLQQRWSGTHFKYWMQMCVEAKTHTCRPKA